MSTPLIISSSQLPAEYYNQFSTYGAVRNECREKSQEEHFRKHVIIFGLTWITSHSGGGDDDDDGGFLAACTSTGELVVWAVPGLKGGVDGTPPIFRCKVSQGKLYSIKFEIVKAKSLLIVSGDEGVSVYDWEKEILQVHLLHQQSTKDKKVAALLSPLSTFRPHPSPLESHGIEVNDFEVLRDNGSNNSCIFGAAGDSFGAYKWDLTTEKLVANYAPTAGGGYLHSLKLLPGSNSQPQTTLLTGGEGGKLNFWDVTTDKLIDQIDLATVSGVNTSTSISTSSSSIQSPSSISRSNSKRSKVTPNRWISSICADDQNWFSVGGGSGGGGGSRSNGGSGFLATYHAPTRSLVSFTETRETPQQLSMLPSSLDSGSDQSLVSVANEGVVSHFDALTLERTRRLWATPPSAYATAVSGDGKQTAVAGVGYYVDIFSRGGEKSMRLAIC